MPTDDPSFDLIVDGLPVRASWSAETVEGVLLPLLDRWERLWRERGESRVVVLLAAPPGTGKSTLSRLLEALSSGRVGAPRLQALPLDGFHYPQATILAGSCVVDGRERPMREVKGTLETFDYPRFSAKLDELRGEGALGWPAYDRGIHDIVDEAIPVTGEIALIEGNWVLSSESPWDGAAPRADDTVFLTADERLLHERLVARKRRGGASPEEAERWYGQTDGMNVRRVLSRRVPAAVELSLSAEGASISCAQPIV